MKYLESLDDFGLARAVQISTSEWSQFMKSKGREFFTKHEHRFLIDAMEAPSREHMEDEDWSDLGMHDKIDNYRIGLTHLTFYMSPNDENNPHPDEVHVEKCKDDWFLVSFYRDDWDGDEGYFEGHEEYYKCDGFECMIDLLERSGAI